MVQFTSLYQFDDKAVKLAFSSYFLHQVVNCHKVKHKKIIRERALQRRKRLFGIGRAIGGIVGGVVTSIAGKLFGGGGGSRYWSMIIPM